MTLFNQVTEKNKDLVREKFFTALKFIKIYEFKVRTKSCTNCIEFLSLFLLDQQNAKEPRPFLTLELGGNCPPIPFFYQRSKALSEGGSSSTGP